MRVQSIDTGVVQEPQFCLTKPDPKALCLLLRLTIMVMKMRGDKCYPGRGKWVKIPLLPGNQPRNPEEPLRG